MEIVVIVCIAIVAIVISIIFTVICYHQMLLVNEVNKRLLLLASESIEKERVTMGELNEALKDLDATSTANMEANASRAVYGEGFNPHQESDELT